MYVIECRPGGYAILHDMGAREMHAAKAQMEPEGWEYREVSAVRAHRWVKAGSLHSTDLWVDSSGRIRRAGIDC